MRLVVEMTKAVNEMELEKAKLEGRVDERREIVGILRDMAREGSRSKREGRVKESMSFTQIVREERKEKEITVVTGTRREPVKAPNVVIIRKDGKESEEMRNWMKEWVDPRKEGINVRRMTKIRNGIALEVGSKEEARRMMESKEMKKIGMDVKEPIHERNLKEEFTEEEMKEEFRIRSRIVEGKGDRRKKLGSLVVECSGRMRNVLRKKDIMLIGWTSSRVKDYIDLPRCYRCQRFGSSYAALRSTTLRSESGWRMQPRRASTATESEPYTRGGRFAAAGVRVVQGRKVSDEQVWAALAVLDERVQMFERDDESDRCCMVVDVRVCECEITVVSVYFRGHEDIRENLQKLGRVQRRRQGRKVLIAGGRAGIYTEKKNRKAPELDGLKGEMLKESGRFIGEEILRGA
ncbi:hypothetical protein J6590_087104 [Homalodisca vitripennis]|nr:hypothetical protein J6590_087104 [Homalodisca vitripennis]